jgi:ERCC4-type nuclease
MMVETLWELATVFKYTNDKLMEPLIRVEPMALPEVTDDNTQLRARVRCLLAVSGLGEDRARAVLSKMGSLQAIANATPEMLICEGVGLTSAKKIVDFFSKKP